MGTTINKHTSMLIVLAINRAAVLSVIRPRRNIAGAYSRMRENYHKSEVRQIVTEMHCATRWLEPPESRLARRRPAGRRERASDAGYRMIAARF